jgi:leucyl/phenylalanyl-tRNA--protein transferase
LADVEGTTNTYGFAELASDFDRPRVEPDPSPWQFPSPDQADSDGFVAVGGDLQAGTLLAAYRAGLFPMPARRQLGWWSPDPRGTIPLDAFHVSRTLRRSCRRFEVRANTAFTEVMVGCGDPRRPHGWINRQFVAAYSHLHALGWAHSVEVYLDDELVGGVYGVGIERLFAGESMFHRATDASKVALVALVDILRARGSTLFDVQWTTPHLRSLGAIDIPRAEYLARLADAVAP